MKDYLEKQVDSNYRNHTHIMNMCNEAVDYVYHKLIEQDLLRESVLDVGCGDGYGLQRFKENMFKEFRGIDCLFDRCNFASKLGFPVMCLDIYDYEIDRQFDLVFSSHFLEHLPDWKKGLDIMISSVKENGHLFLVVPVLGNIPQSSAHFSFFDDEAEIVKYLEENEMKVIEFKIKQRSDKEVWILAQKI